MNKTNQAGSPRTNARFEAPFRKSRLTEAELAKVSGLHINTVKKILRADHVHPNSETKLERALQQYLAEHSRRSDEGKVTQLHHMGTDSSLAARKRSLLVNAEALAVEASDLVIGLAKSGEVIGATELAQLRTFMLLATNAISLLENCSKT